MARLQLPNRVQTWLRKSLYSSLGSVVRNYSQQAEFNPTKQVVGITYKAIDKIGLKLSVYEPQVLKANGDTYTNHPLLTLFNQPNPRVNSASDFVHLYGMLYEIYGETFWYMAKGETTNRVKELYLLNPAQIQIITDEGEVVGYVLHKNNGQRIPFEIDEIYHDKRPNPFNELRGLSVLEMAAMYINTEIVTTEFTLNYIRNSGSPSGIVTLPNMTSEAFQMFTAQWREGYEGPKNAGKTAFIRGDEAKFQAVGATLQDVDQKITKTMAQDDVLMMFDVPRPLLGLTDANGFGRGNVETLNYIFAESKIEPMMRRLDRIYEHIGRSFAKEGVINVTHVSPIPEDKDYILKENQSMLNRALTVNEVRARMGLDKLPNGDVLDPTNTVNNQTTTQSAKVITEKQVIKLVKAKKDTSRPDPEQFRQKLVANNDVFVKKVKREITQFAEKQEAVVIDKISTQSKSFTEWLFSVKEEAIKLADSLMPIMTELIDIQKHETANFITGEAIEVSPQMIKTVETNIKQIAGVYNTDTIKALEKTLNQGAVNGDTLVQLKKRVESVYSDAKGYRAERIARTESLRTSNLTAEEVYKQSGYSEVEWFTNPGACEFCRTYSGRTKMIGGVYNNIGDVITGDEGGQLRIEYSDVPSPPLHPNCTCSLIPKG